ncbi:MAG: glucokinase [Gammaproteobacteria bacterium]|nr:MAG: glucokinase [Gammaproteobacteria bacterium]
MILLAGDIGGTHSRLVLARQQANELVIIREQTCQSQKQEGLVSMVQHFLSANETGQTPTSACFAIAGPVTNNRARVTNLLWRLNAEELQKSFRIEKVKLINDFQAIAYGIDGLARNELLELQSGNPEPRANRAILGAGTGLGQGMMVWCHDRYQAIASEGGHADFAPRNSMEIELLNHLLEQQPRVSYEDVLSGEGLLHIYQFVRDKGELAESGELAKAMQHDDPSAVISRFAIQKHDPLAQMSLDLFIAIYGAQAANLALISMARGGLYIAGGIAPKIAMAIKNRGFMQAFLEKQPMTDLLESIPVYLIMNTRVGLLGALSVAKDDPETRPPILTV